MVQEGQTSPCYDADFLPFGYEKQVTNTCAQNYKFEGKERDTETGNDDFGARYYSNHFGRWLSPDWSAVPAPVPYANLTNPQTLNLYGMVSDNPESFADLDGHDTIKSPPPTSVASDDPICLNVDSPKGACNLELGGEFLREVTTDANNGNSDPAKESQKADQDATNPVLQTVQDTAVGGAKGVANQVIDLANFVNTYVDAGLSALGINYSFGQGQELQPSNEGEKGAMLGISIASFFVGGGEEKAATKVETLTADAEKAYPKLAGKFQEHHIIPKYLGGAKDGETVRLPAAYHQLITNEFRKLAPYGQSIERSAQEVGNILQQVYSTYPLPR